MKPLLTGHNQSLEAWIRFLHESDQLENIGLPTEEYRRALTCFTDPDEDYPTYSENHARSFWYVVRHWERLPTTLDIKELHQRLLRGDSSAGRFQDLLSENLVRRWCASLTSSSDPFEKHLEFSHMGAFREGNGRVARLLWAWLRLHNKTSVDLIYKANEESLR